MFARLAGLRQTKESFENTPHKTYINNQTVYLDAVPNMIPSGSSGLQGFDKAIQSVDTVGTQYQNYAIKQPNAIFMQDVSPELSELARQCAASNIDSLIATKNPAASLGCGWLYSPPNSGSPYPLVSKGFVGTTSAPLPNFNPPDHKKWFFDLQLAKKQMLLDKCKALKGCAEVDNDVFKGTCGFCTDTNQGVPIDAVGRPLYENDSRGNCSPDSIVKRSSQCPPPPPPGAGPQPIVDRTCDPVNGRLSSECVYRQVIAAGCTDAGALAIALHSSPNPNDYIATLNNSDAVKIYNRVSNPPLNLDIFRQGNTTIGTVLNEVRQLAGNASRPINTGIGAAARDLCLKRGTISSYDTCSELSDGAVSPFELRCLQSIFSKMGGLPVGTMYPTNETIANYNAMGNLGAVKQYLSDLMAKMNSTDYEIQREAMIKFLGIRPEKMIQRAPYTQGVEVFWFTPTQWGDISLVGSFLKRTIERDFIQYPAGPSRFPQIGNTVNAAMMQMTDVRAQTDASVKFHVQVDDGFYITVNQPTEYDYTALRYGNMDKPGHFASMLWQGPTMYRANTPAVYHASTPNITKAYFVDGGGWMAFTMNAVPNSGTSPFQSKYYSLTCEPRAPFLTYEVNLKSGVFEELRNPALFSKILEQSGLDNHIRTDERNGVPGKKGFTRMNQNSIINLRSIAYQSWKTMTVMMRFNSMPIKESIINLAMGDPGTYYYNLILTPINGSTMGCHIEYNFGEGNQRTNNISAFTINKWTIFIINNKGNGFEIQIHYLEHLISSKGSGRGGNSRLNAPGPLFKPNGIWNPVSEGHNLNACNIMIGSAGYRESWAAMYATPAFSYDVAWVHFFDKTATDEDMYRECMADWIYTQSPSSYDKYNTLE